MPCSGGFQSAVRSADQSHGDVAMCGPGGRPLHRMQSRSADTAGCSVFTRDHAGPPRSPRSSLHPDRAMQALRTSREASTTSAPRPSRHRAVPLVLCKAHSGSAGRAGRRAPAPGSKAAPPAPQAAAARTDSPPAPQAATPAPNLQPPAEAAAPSTAASPQPLSPYPQIIVSAEDFSVSWGKLSAWFCCCERCLLGALAWCHVSANCTPTGLCNAHLQPHALRFTPRRHPLASCCLSMCCTRPPRLTSTAASAAPSLSVRCLLVTTCWGHAAICRPAGKGREELHRLRDKWCFVQAAQDLSVIAYRGLLQQP